MSYAAGTHYYVATVAEAKSWIESEAARVRPELFEAVSTRLLTDDEELGCKMLARAAAEEKRKAKKGGAR